MTTNYKPKAFRAAWLTDAVATMYAATGGILPFVALAVVFIFGSKSELARVAVYLGASFYALGIIACTYLNRQAERASQVEFVHKWINSAPDAEQQAQRSKIFAVGGMGAALGAAGVTAFDSSMLTPRVNVDGSPMMGNIDINGNPYGMVGAESGAWNSDTGGFAADDTAYKSPIGMDFGADPGMDTTQTI